MSPFVISRKKCLSPFWKWKKCLCLSSKTRLRYPIKSFPFPKGGAKCMYARFQNRGRHFFWFWKKGTRAFSASGREQVLERVFFQSEKVPAPSILFSGKVSAPSSFFWESLCPRPSYFLKKSPPQSILFSEKVPAPSNSFPEKVSAPPPISDWYLFR